VQLVQVDRAESRGLLGDEGRAHGRRWGWWLLGGGRGERGRRRRR
jgi:hypothetical protein